LATQQRTEAQLRAILEAYHPAPAQLFSTIDRQITLAFIANYPTPGRCGGGRAAHDALPGPQPLHRPGQAPGVGRAAAGQPAHRRAGAVAGKAHSALIFAELLGLLNQQLADYDDAIALAVERHPDAAIFASFPYNSLKESTWASEAYQQARARGQHPTGPLRGLGARWMRVLWRCWIDRVPHDPAKHHRPTIQPTDQQSATA
jgi:hypothetical protein